MQQFRDGSAAKTGKNPGRSAMNGLDDYSDTIQMENMIRPNGHGLALHMAS